MAEEIVIPVFKPHEGMNLDKVPIVDQLQVENLVRTALVVVEEEPESDASLATRREVRLMPGYRGYSEDDGFEEVTAEDLEKKWRSVMAKGDTGYDGVYKSTVNGRTVYHFWDDTSNNVCDDTHKAITDFSATMTTAEAAWFSKATGLNPKDGACWTSLDEGERYNYKFAINQGQIDTYLKRMERFYLRKPNGITPDRYAEFQRGLMELKPPDEFWKHNAATVLAFGVGVPVLAGGGALLFRHVANKREAARAVARGAAAVAQGVEAQAGRSSLIVVAKGVGSGARTTAEEAAIRASAAGRNGVGRVAGVTSKAGVAAAVVTIGLVLYSANAEAQEASTDKKVQDRILWDRVMTAANPVCWFLGCGDAY